jgi:hypothetical protein
MMGGALSLLFAVIGFTQPAPSLDYGMRHRASRRVYDAGHAL